MTQVGNIIIETATGSGTGNLTLAAFPFYRRFSDGFGTGSGNKFYYCIRHRAANEYEVGIGYCLDANTIVRETIIESSNANALVSFTVGDKDAICDVPASLQLAVPYTGATGDVTLGAFDLQAQEMTVGNGAVGHDPLLTFDGENHNNTIKLEEYVNSYASATYSRLVVNADDDNVGFVAGNISAEADDFLKLFSSFSPTSSVAALSGGVSFMTVEAQDNVLPFGGVMLLMSNTGSLPLDGEGLGTVFAGGNDGTSISADKGFAFLAHGDWTIDQKSRLSFFSSGSPTNAIMEFGGDDVVYGNVGFNVNNDLVWNGVTEPDVLFVDASLNRVNTYDLRHNGANLGFYGATPVARNNGWNVTNVTTDKSFDANATTIDELADVLGTLIEQLKTYGLLGG